jgi:hypothetical protein
MTAPTVGQVRSIAVSIEGLTRQLVHYSSLASVGACLELRDASTALDALVAVPPPEPETRSPLLPIADIADAIRYQLRLVDALTADVRLRIPVITAHTHLQMAWRYLR